MSIPVGSRCEIVNCQGLVVAKGLCAKHYKRLQRHGDVNHRVRAGGTELGCKAYQHPLYYVWNNAKVSGGKLLCERWRDFNNFVADIGEKPDDAVSFQRIDRNKGFEPGNVVWSMAASTPEQRANRREYMRENSRKHRAANPEYYRNVYFKKKYGVTIDWFNERFKEQNGVCAICGQSETSVIKGKLVSLSVDHCHQTGVVRGLLCSNCNFAISRLHHDPELLSKAIEYLNRSGSTIT